MARCIRWHEVDDRGGDCRRDCANSNDNEHDDGDGDDDEAAGAAGKELMEKDALKMVMPGTLH